MGASQGYNAQCSVVPKLEQGGGVGLAILIRRASQEGLQRPEKNFNASFFKTLLLDANLSPPQRKSGDARSFFSAQISVACSLQAHLEALGFWTNQKVS